MKPNYKSQLCTDARMGPLLCIARCENIPLFNSSTQFVQQTVTISDPLHSAELGYKLLEQPRVFPAWEITSWSCAVQPGRGQPHVCASLGRELRATQSLCFKNLHPDLTVGKWEGFRTCCKTQLLTQGLEETNVIDQHYLEEERGDFSCFFFFFSW